MFGQYSTPEAKQYFNQRSEKPTPQQPIVESGKVVYKTKSSFWKDLFSKKEEPLKELPSGVEDLQTLYKDADNVIKSYQEKKLKIQYGQYASAQKQQTALDKLEEEKTFADGLIERIKGEVGSVEELAIGSELSKFLQKEPTNPIEKERWLTEKYKQASLIYKDEDNGIDEVTREKLITEVLKLDLEVVVLLLLVD